MKQFDVLLDNKITQRQFDVFIEDKSKKYQFDILINNNSTECDIVILSLPYRDTFAAINNLVLSQRMNLLSRKIITANNIQELIADVSGIIKKYPERVKQNIEITSNIDEITKYSLFKSENELISISNVKDLFYRVHISGNTTAEIVADIDEVARKYIVPANDPLMLNLHTDSAVLKKVSSGKNSLSISSGEVEVSETQYTALSKSVLEIIANIEILAKRWRQLSDMDDSALNEFDMITLEELDYITIN